MSDAANDIGKLFQTIWFFKSVIDSGERWSVDCQSAYDEARAIASRLTPEPSVEEVAAAIARGHEPVNGWGTRGKTNDAWCDGFRTACVEISDAIKAQLAAKLKEES